MANKKLTSLRSDVVPYLVARQGQPNSYLRENVPGLAHRRRPLQELESWRVNLRAITPSHLLLPFDVNTSLPTELSSTPGSLEENPDLLRCFAVVVDRDPTPGNKGPICQRIATLQTYLHLNRSPFLLLSPTPPPPPPPPLLTCPPETSLFPNHLKPFDIHCVVISGPKFQIT
jgi:hypothetical protein